MSSEARTYYVSVGRREARVLEKGDGPKLGYLAGLAGVPRWTPFLDALSHDYRVICPSLPGFPGADGHEDLDHLIDWIAVALDLLESAGLAGEDIAAASLGAMLALEIAALSPGTFRRMALMAPLGLYEEAAPIPHIWARRSSDLPGLLVTNTAELTRLQSAPDDLDPVEWNLILSRATAAGARLLWPTCDLGLAKRLHRVRNPLLLIWGLEDRIADPSYLKSFTGKIVAPTQTATIAGAGHLVDIDAPDQAALLIRRFLSE